MCPAPPFRPPTTRIGFALPSSLALEIRRWLSAPPAADGEQIVDRIDRERVRAELRVGPFQDTNRRHVAFGRAGEDEDLVALRDKNLIMHGIDREPVRVAQLRERALDHPDRRLLTVRAAAEGEDRLAELLRHHELVVALVIDDRVHRPAEHRLLPLNFSYRVCASVRQPGEHRYLRVGYSIGHEYLLALAVVCDGMRIADRASR